MKIKNKDYKKMIFILKKIENICEDLHVSNGMIRQRGNTKQSIFIADLSNIYPKDFNLTLIKNRIPLFKIFEKVDEVSFDVINNNLVISDGNTTIKIAQSAVGAGLLEQEYIPDANFNKIADIANCNLVLDKEIPESFLSRILSLSKSFNVDRIQLNFDNDKVTLTMRSQDKALNSEVIVLDLEDGHGIENGKSSIMVIDPFTMFSSDVNLKMYRKGKTRFLAFFEATENDIPVKVLSVSEIAK